MATTVEKPSVQIKKNHLPREVLYWHIAGIAAVGLALIGLTIWIAQWVVPAAANSGKDDPKVAIPAYDYQAWKAFPVQHKGRIKPMQIAANDTMIEIVGRTKFKGRDPLPMILMWMLENPPKAVAPQSKWDNVPFILCENQELRKLIFLLQDDGSLGEETKLKEDQIHGKYMSPKRLKLFVNRLKRLEQDDYTRYRQLTDKVEEEILAIYNPHPVALGRLELYEQIRKTEITEDEIEDYLPFVSFVPLDKVPGTPWFSIPELRLVKQQPETWYELLKQRVRKTPHLYLDPETHLKSLQEFQASLQRGTGLDSLQELEQPMADHRKVLVEQYATLRKTGENRQAADLISQVLRTWPRDINEENFHKQIAKYLPILSDDNLQQIFAKEKNKQAGQILIGLLDLQVEDRIKRLFQVDSNARTYLLAQVQREPEPDTLMFQELLEKRDQLRLAELEDMLPAPEEYTKEDRTYQMLHMTYLEMRYPNLYTKVITWQDPPLEKIDRVLASYDALGEAYRSGDAEKFNKKSQEFFQTIEDVGEKLGPYPGDDTIASRLGGLFVREGGGQPSEELLQLELTFNKVRPFMWGWILMLGAMVMFAFSLGLQQGMPSRICYLVAWAFFAGSLIFQTFGFFTRIIIAARPPVTNMYETIIWVAFMSTIFALVLELIFRRKVIALAGALVATLGLVLADQLPLAFDPQIKPLVPVLRSNFWLTIHVLTIVSSYAGGTLAWGLGNISLLLIVLGSTRKDTIKMLSNFTYRALQIAVLLLAIGTFLGGWWAAYSWGRFWGWDPKETGALIALVCYVIPLHMRYIGWIKEFGLAVSAILCYAAIILAWYGINFLIPAGLHSYGTGSGGKTWLWVAWAASLNIMWVLVASLIYRYRLSQPADGGDPPSGAEMA